MSKAAAWGTRLDAAVCEQCDWSYLLPANSPPQRCPHCFRVQLTAVNDVVDQLPYIHPPELVITPKVSSERVAAQIESFAKGIPFRAKDLTAENLQQRLRHTYVPLWLVDGDVRATWQAEVGYDYQVVSHREKYSQDGSGWNTEQVKETRIRWEPRVGRLNRTYHNQQAPALEEEREMARRLGKYKVETAESYHPRLISQAFIRLPNRPPDDAWPDAEPNFLQTGIAECQQAAEADHIRDFRWTADFQNRHWTQLLRSAYTTYYLDDDNVPHTVLINGQNGYISGSRRSSMQRARRWTFGVLAVAALFFVLGVVLGVVGFFYEAAFTVGVLSVVAALAIAFISLLPLFLSWNFNRKESKKN